MAEAALTMALKPCKECYQEISSHAKVCPHCGRKNPRQGKIPYTIERFSNWLLKVGLWGMLIMFLLWLAALVVF